MIELKKDMLVISEWSELLLITNIDKGDWPVRVIHLDGDREGEENGFHFAAIQRVVGTKGQFPEYFL